MKKRTLFLVLLIVALVVIPCAIASASYHYVGGTDAVELRKLPYDNAKILDKYRKDFAIISYKKYNDNWAYVRFSDNNEGYVRSKYCKVMSNSFYRYLNDDSIALRKGPATKYDKVATLTINTKVTVLTQGASWSYVSVAGTKGYVQNKQLSKTKTKVPEGNYTAYVVNDKGNKVNVRNGAGKGYAVITSLEPGTAVKVLEHGKTWDKIRYENITGWMMNQYLSKTRPRLPDPAPDPSPSPKPTSTPFVPYTMYTTAKTGKTVNLRNGHGMGYGIIMRIPLGSPVTVMGRYDNTWTSVEYEGVTGYLKHEFLRKLPYDVEEITLNASKKTIYTGTAQQIASKVKETYFQLKATIDPWYASYQKVKWTSSDKTVATVSGKGLVTAVGVGKTTITCTATDGTGIKAKCVITVKAPTLITDITPQKAKVTLDVGETYKPLPEIKPFDATYRTLKWKSDNKDVATVTSDGKIKAVKAGTANITCTATDGSGVSATIRIVVR